MNVKGLRNAVKRRAIFNYVRQRADIICLQETHSEITDELFWKAEWGGSIAFSHGERNARGVCILIKKDIQYEQKTVPNNGEGRIVLCDVTTIRGTVSLCAIYAPNREHTSFFVNMLQTVIEATDNVIIIGDFNLALDCCVDRTGCKTNNNKSAEILNTAINDLLYTNIWRVRNPEVKRWWYMR